jgi:hypothetical protein
MTGVFKGARHSKEALERFPGSLFVEKPFDAKKLLETCERLVPPTRRLGCLQPSDPPPTPTSTSSSTSTSKTKSRTRWSSPAASR